MKWRIGTAVRDRLVLLAWGALGFGGVLIWEDVQTSSPEKPNLARGADAAERKGPTEALADVSARTIARANAPAAARVRQALRASRDVHAGLPGTTVQPSAPMVNPDTRRAATADRTAADNPAAREDTAVAADDATSAASPDTSPESIRTLAETLTTDPDTDHRIRAITELRSLAVQGHEVSTVRDTLRLASADDDADVAERAKDAYDDLIQTLD